MKGNFHVRFWRRVRIARFVLSLTRSVAHIAVTAMTQYVWAVQVIVRYAMNPYAQAVFRNVLNAKNIFAKDVSLKIYVRIVTN